MPGLHMKVMRPVPALLAAMCLPFGAAAPATAIEREVGAHRHGHGTVNMAIEGRTVLIELEAPGADIVGFEYPAVSAAENDAFAAARTLLESPLQLFVLPSDAGCSVDSVTVAPIGKYRHDAGDAPENEEELVEGHAEFHGEYRLSCAHPERMNMVTFTYFDQFPEAQALEVYVITAERQVRYEIVRGDPVMRLEDN